MEITKLYNNLSEVKKQSFYEYCYILFCSDILTVDQKDNFAHLQNMIKHNSDGAINLTHKLYTELKNA